MCRIKFSFFLIFLCLSFQLKSQNWITVENEIDSISYKSNEILITKDSVYFAPVDSFAILTKGEKYKIKENPYSKNENFYDSLQVKTYKKRVYREIYQMVIRSAPVQVTDSLNIGRGEKIFVPYKGMKIRNIKLIKVDVIEGSVFDTTVVARSFLGKGVNNIHLDTRNYVIYNNLTIKAGDIVDPFQLADNARLLRNSPYLEDARIQVEPIFFDTTQIDLIIITKDKISVGAGVDYNGFDNLKFFIYDKNFLGIGHEMRHYLIYRKDNNPEYGYALRYGINNISKSFISAVFNYEHSWDKGFIGARLDKAFLTQRTKYAGGINLYDWSDKREIMVSDSLNVMPYRTLNQDYWIGRAFMVNQKSQTTFNVAVRFANANFIERPYITRDSNQYFHERSAILVSLSLVNIKYFLGSMIYGFGVTEDIPIGFRLGLTSGYVKNQFVNQNYLGTNIGFSQYFKFPGFLTFNIEFGKSFNQNHEWDRIAKIRFLNIGNLHKMYNFSHRSFFDFSIQSGRSLSDPLSKAIVDNKWTKMIQGLNHDELKGDQKLTINFQNVLFTPWNLIGFKFALTSNINMGWVSNYSFELSSKSYFSTLGFGLRIKNESWIFETITIGLAYLFKAPEGSNKIGFIIDGSDPRFFKHLYTGRPEIVTMDESPALFLE